MIAIKDSKNSQREKDENGFLIVRNNPIAKAGVFDYLLKEVEPKNDSSDIVKVYRDWDMLKSIKDSFANKPIKDDHYWVGDESNTADGAIGSVITTDEQNKYLIADLFIYNPLLIEKIENGVAIELSPAYTSEVIKEKGNYEGVDYEYKQNIKCFNHLAVVEQGRSGKDLKIQDKKETKMKFKDKLFESLSKFFDENQEALKDDEAKTQDNNSEIAKQILAIATKEGDENEKIEAINNLLSKLTQSKDEDETKDEGETENKDDDLQTEATETSETSEQASVNVSELKQEILSEVAEAVEEAIVKAQDSARQLQKAKEVAYQKVQDSIKTPFDYSQMNIKDIYATGYKALTGIEVDKSLDSETAFVIASNSIKSSTNNISMKDSSTNTLNLSKFK